MRGRGFGGLLQFVGPDRAFDRVRIWPDRPGCPGTAAPDLAPRQLILAPLEDESDLQARRRMDACAPALDRYLHRRVSLRCTFGIPGQASRTDGGSSGQAETVPVGALNADSLILLDADAEIELQDGSWVNARVGTQCRNRDGRWFLYLCRSPGLSRLAQSARSAAVALAMPGNWASPADLTLRSGPEISADKASSRSLDHWPEPRPANFEHRGPDLARVDRPAPTRSKLTSEHGANMGTKRTHKNDLER